ncbi:MAG TPA: oxidoreductase [Anaeromyxobacteraceae bacterium]|nr:oxidoreductase [Anaeromyxobacteraceae bacterium]
MWRAPSRADKFRDPVDDFSPDDQVDDPTSYVSAPAARKRVRVVEGRVAEVVREARDAVTLVLELEEPPEYQAGQFLTLDPHQFHDLEDLTAYLEDAKGRREPPRAYSLSSSPLEPCVAITVKEERYKRGSTPYPPLLSPYLVRRAARGQRVRVVGFTGAYVLPRDVEAKTDHLVHIVAGSGSVPNYAILKYALAVHPRLRQSFVYSNRTWEDVIFREGLAGLKARFPGRLHLLHALTREEGAGRHGPWVRQGRVGPELLREAIPDPSSCLVYACGPAVGSAERARARERGEMPAPRFLEGVKEALLELGVPPGRVRTEAYG